MLQLHMKLKIFYSLMSMIIIISSTEHSYSQWTRVNRDFGGTIYALKSNGNYLLASNLDSIFISSNNGGNWTSTSTGISGFEVIRLETLGEYYFAGTGNYGVYRSNDNGFSWKPANVGMINTYYYVSQFLVDNDIIFAGTGGGVFLSADTGASWKPINNGLKNIGINSLTGNRSHLFADVETGSARTGENSDLYYSSDNGNNWTLIDKSVPGTAIASFGDTLLASNANGIFIYTKSDSNWNRLNTGVMLGGGVIGSFQSFGKFLFGAISNGRIYRSTDNGLSWVTINDSLFCNYIWSLSLNNKYLFAGTDNGIWFCPISELMTGVKNTSRDALLSFRLKQNYPNPFNPSTTLSFYIPTKSFVSLKIFDLLGREKETIVSQVLPAGEYTREWRAIGYPSGIYFYRLQYDNYKETKKMILLK